MSVFSIQPTVLNDNFSTGARDDTLGGYLGNDVLSAGDGNDVIFEGQWLWIDRSSGPFIQYETYQIGAGSDTLDGGAGTDVLSYAFRTVGITLNLLSGVAISGAERDQISGFELYALTEGNDLVIGDALAIGFDLGGGDDTLLAGAGLSFADGGVGSDLIDLRAYSGPVYFDLLREISPDGLSLTGFEEVFGAAEFANTLIGGDADNVFLGGRLADSLNGGYGRDSLYGLAGDDSLDGSYGNDLLRSGQGDDLVYGGEQNDLIINDGGVDVLYGGKGLDTIFGHDLEDRIYGGLGYGRGGFDYLYGGGGNDTIEVGHWAAKLFGGLGDDVLDSTQPGAFASGGVGNDTIRSAGLSYGGDGDDVFSGYGDKRYGGDGDDVFQSAMGRIYAGNGDDLITAAAGESYMLSALLGAGDDTLKAANVGADLLISGENGNDTIVLSYGFGGVYGGKGDDRLYVGAANIYGGIGNDRITLGDGAAYGGHGDDQISVKNGPGAYVEAGAGNDHVILGSVTETSAWGPVLTALGGEGIDRLTVHSGRLLISDVPIYEDGILTSVSGFEIILITSDQVDVRYIRDDDQMIFGKTNDLLVIETANSTYDLGAGNDQITVMAANVTVHAGDGNDVIGFGQGSAAEDGDFILHAGAGDDWLGLYTPGAAYGGAGNDRADVQDAVSFHAGDGNDRATFGSTIYNSTNTGFVESSPDMSTMSSSMGAGNDVAVVVAHMGSLDMGAGNDTVSIYMASDEPWDLWGGDGVDRFQFRTEGTVSCTIIKDFDVTEDLLSYYAVWGLADLDEITAYAGGVRIVEQNWVVYLEGVSLDQMADSLFSYFISTGL